MVGIYKYTNRLNGKSYIGKSANIEKRRKGHLKRAKEGDLTCFHNALRKYGEHNFDFEIIEICTEEELNARERFYIKEFDTIAPKGYNMTEGGDGGNMFKCRTEAQNKETRRKMSESHKGLLHTEDSKKKCSLAQKGRKLPHLSKFCGWNKGLKMPPEFGLKTRRVGAENGMYGKKQSKLCRETNSKIHKGQVPFNKGKHLVWDNAEHTKFHYE